MAVRIGSASIDERGKASGGKAGDQTGKEVKYQNYYTHGKGWNNFRALDPDIRDAIAEGMEHAVENNMIGYDQSQRTSLYSQVKLKGFDPAKATVACETDCSALVRVCICYATQKVLGKVIDPGNFRTATQKAYLMRTGLFELLTDSEHCATSVRLARGDILCTKTSGHTVVVLTDGSKCDASKAAERVLKKGCKGEDVRELQYDLILLGYDCGVCGADGEYGADTASAVMLYQQEHGMKVSGNADADTIAAIKADKLAATQKHVTVTGASVYVRSAPGKDASVLGVVHKGDVLTYQGQTSDGWYLVIFDGKNGWISGNMSEVGV